MVSAGQKPSHSGKICNSPWLERVLQRKLYLPLRTRLRLEGSPRDCRKRRTCRTRIRQEEARVIGQIEELCPELQRLPLGDAEFAIYAKVKIFQTGPAQDVPPCVAKCADRIDAPRRRIVGEAIASRNTIRKQRARIEPAIGGRIGDTPVADHVWPVRATSGIALITPGGHGERPAPLRGENTRNLPSA